MQRTNERRSPILDGKYIAAWTTNQPEDIRALFTEDAVYATRPNDRDPRGGREQIVDRWLAARDEPDEWTFEWTQLGTDGDLAFVQGFTHYLGDRPSYDNLWVIRLAPDGRATQFTEWFMEPKVEPGSGHAGCTGRRPT